MEQLDKDETPTDLQYGKTSSPLQAQKRPQHVEEAPGTHQPGENTPKASESLSRALSGFLRTPHIPALPQKQLPPSLALGCQRNPYRTYGHQETPSR